MNSKKIGLLLLSSVLFLSACKKKSDEKSQKTITVAIQSAPVTLDPRRATDAYGMRFANLLFSSLVKVGSKLDIVGDAAESWTYKDLTYTFNLKPGLRFSNGDWVEPEDILFSFKEYQNPSNVFHRSYKDIKKVESEFINNTGERLFSERQLQVRLHLKEFSATLLADLPILKILPRKVVKKFGKDFGENIVGSGSFSLVSQSPSEIILKSVKDHAWDSPKIDGVTFKVIKDKNTLFLKTIKGDVDISQSQMPLDKVRSLKTRSHLTTVIAPGVSMAYLIFNLKHKLLQNHEVRKAIAMSINRLPIIEHKFHNLSSAATSILSPSSLYHAKTMKNPDFNPEEAKKILSKYDLSKNKLVFKTTNDPAVVEVAKILSQQLRKVGFNIQIQSFEWGTYYQDVKSGRFEMAIMNWVGAIDPDIYRTAFHSKNFPPGRNRGFYSNTKVDKLLEEGIRIEDIKKRIDHYTEIQTLIMNDLPTLPLWYPKQVAVINQRVKNYFLPANGDYRSLTQVTIEDF